MGGCIAVANSQKNKGNSTKTNKEEVHHFKFLTKLGI